MKIMAPAAIAAASLFGPALAGECGLPDANQRIEIAAERARLREATRDLQVAVDETLTPPPRRPPPDPRNVAQRALSAGMASTMTVNDGRKDVQVVVMPGTTPAQGAALARRERERSEKEPPIAHAIDDGDVQRVRSLLAAGADTGPLMTRAAQRWHNRLSDAGEDPRAQADLANRYIAILRTLGAAKRPADATVVAVIESMPYRTPAGLRIPGSLELMRELLARRGELALPLRDAIVLQDDERFDAMMRFGRPSQLSKNTALKASLPERHWPAAMRLLDAGADASVVDAELFFRLMNPYPHPRRVVKALVARGVDPGMVFDDGYTPLMYSMHDHELMKMLVDAGARVDARTRAEGMTALHFAALAYEPRRGDPVSAQRYPLYRASAAQMRLASVRMLLASGVDADARDARGQTPLMLTSPDDGEAIRLLLDAGGKVNAAAALDGCPATQSPVAWALLHGNETLAVALLRRSPAVRSDDAAVRYAAAGGYSVALGVLLDAGVPAGARDETGRTPLLIAASQGHAELVQVLLDKRAASVDERSMAATLRGEATASAPNEAARAFAKALDLARQQAEIGHTALMLAAGAGREDVVQLLLRYGADVNAHDAVGRTPLDYARQSRSRDTARVSGLLVSKGAKPGLFPDQRH